MAQRSRSVARAILLATLIAGTLNLADMMLFFGLHYRIPPTWILQSFACHVLGLSAFSDGIHVALFGLVLHYLITAIWTTAFIFIAQHVRFLFHRAIASGVAYGIFIYLVMNYIVLPHVPVPSPTTQVPLIFLDATFSLILCVGLPISLLNSRFAPVPPVS